MIFSQKTYSGLLALSIFLSATCSGENYPKSEVTAARKILVSAAFHFPGGYGAWIGTSRPEHWENAGLSSYYTSIAAFHSGEWSKISFLRRLAYMSVLAGGMPEVEAHILQAIVQTLNLELQAWNSATSLTSVENKTEVQRAESAYYWLLALFLSEHNNRNPMSGGEVLKSIARNSKIFSIDDTLLLPPKMRTLVLVVLVRESTYLLLQGELPQSAAASVRRYLRSKNPYLKWAIDAVRRDARKKFAASAKYSYCSHPLLFD